MRALPQSLRVTLDSGESVSAVAYAPPARQAAGVTLILGHGAGAGQNSSFMVDVATGLAARGIDVVTFNFAYMEQRRRLPDPNDRLEACYRAVIEGVRAKGAKKLAIGGKSMGGRIASQIASSVTGLTGVVLLGYPLHPPGKPRQQRIKHLPGITVPVLFVQGTRDNFGTVEELRTAIRSLPAAELYPVESGDHSFKVLKRSGIPQERVYAEIHDKVADWLRGAAASRR